MAVVTKFVVVRGGVEIEPVFAVKKEAEAYDKMLDAADAIAQLMRDGGFGDRLEADVIEGVAILLAKNGPEVVRMLKGVKPLTPPSAKEDAPTERKPVEKAPKPPAAKSGSRGRK